MPETIEAKLLSFTETHLVLETNNKQLPVQIIPRNSDITEIKLFDLKTGLITKPTLLWRVSAEKGGDHDVQVSYQTDALTWRADYNVVVNKDDAKADLSAWVTLGNESGATYTNARLKLIAGDVRRFSRRPEPIGGGGGASLFGGGGPPKVTQRPFFEYHLYTLPRPVTLPDNSVKQIELIAPKLNVPVTKTYVYRAILDPDLPQTGTPFDNVDPGFAVNRKVDVVLKLANTAANNLGIPLPAGHIRVYKRDDQDAADDPAGALEFVGEDRIDHTPKDEPVLIRVGSAFDLVGDRIATNFATEPDKRTMSETFDVKIRNHKKEPVTVTVQEPLYRWHNWEITASSDKFTKTNARTIQFTVDVPPDKEKTITYTVKYSW
jgi:hypothetical protein